MSGPRLAEIHTYGGGGVVATAPSLVATLGEQSRQVRLYQEAAGCLRLA